MSWMFQKQQQRNTMRKRHGLVIATIIIGAGGGLVLYFFHGNENNLVPGMQDTQDAYADSSPVAVANNVVAADTVSPANR